MLLQVMLKLLLLAAFLQVLLELLLPLQPLMLKQNPYLFIEDGSRLLMPIKQILLPPEKILMLMKRKELEMAP
jgi:hypothetical protein